MTLSAIILILFIVLCVVFLTSCIVNLFKDNREIRAKKARLLELLALPQSAEGQSRFAPPAILTHGNWAYNEGRFPGLFQVIVLADTVDQPVNGLERAVLENFKRGVKYCFIVSASHAQEELNGFYGLFEKLADIAVNKFKAPYDPKKLVRILSLPDEWNNVPYVFYRMKGSGQDGSIKTIAFRGDIERAGIANKYIAVDHDSAEALWKLLMGRPPEAIERAVVEVNQDQFVDPGVMVRLAAQSGPRFSMPKDDS